ncbi:TITAN-like protein isoform X1 [Nicotiana tabacum]|uniref:TITAN-like protein isoform X1 n=1 Tax=Nicotiana sylvestris TaxID=4096 RepID=A0A1U7YDG6_NICSY|nr:PREDICTED: TITAN-like protein isoform X1 [Nicotiana sylvestris]XP_009799987.1 PREDICTED: TITAN-like protein isoform X1 [Nicotiana sylvestris]
MSNDKQFELCVVCKLNHNQGRRHNFLPNHKKSLAATLSRFQSKLSDIRFFIKNPIPLRPEHASLNRLWCLFCECDILELDSFFASDNAIRHLASAGHMKKVKGFLWKYGGGMDKVDNLRITEADFAKWEKKCNLLKKGALDGGSRATLIGPSNDIQNKTNTDYLNCFDKDNIHALNLDVSNSVVPLQNYTNERSQISENEMRSVTNGPNLPGTCMGGKFGEDACSSNGVANGQNYSRFRDTTSHQCLNGGSVTPDGRMTKGRKISLGPPNIAQISLTFRENSLGNVHSGAPPPWFNETEKSHLDFISNPGGSDLPPPNKKSKLNPNRVGAAWAERRKAEMELESKGELVTSNYDVNWLPNFGRVWQSGTRKESRKEFQVENNKFAKVESQSQSMVQLQPYISKRKRKDTVVDELD